MIESTHDWMLAITKAADELGYLVISIDPLRVRLVRADDRHTEIELYGRFVSGDYIRRTLHKVEPKR